MSSVLRPIGVKNISMITIQEIQKQLSDAIKYSGITQSELGKRIGVSQQTISHYIKGDKMPSLDTFANICEVLDLDIYEILCVNNEKGRK